MTTVARLSRERPRMSSVRLLRAWASSTARQLSCLNGVFVHLPSRSCELSRGVHGSAGCRLTLQCPALQAVLHSVHVDATAPQSQGRPTTTYPGVWCCLQLFLRALLVVMKPALSLWQCARPSISTT